jgi:ferredoxin
MHRVDEAACTGCGKCVEVCPSEAIALTDGRARIDDAICMGCGSCAGECPQGAIVMADIAVSVYTSIKPTAGASAIIPANAADLARRAEVEIMPAASRLHRFWPLVGSGLVWASRELLPGVISAWQASRVGVSHPVHRRFDAVNRQAAMQQRHGQRHRWGRA